MVDYRQMVDNFDPVAGLHILLRRYQFLQVIYGKAKNEVKECESLVLLGEVGISGLHPDNFDSVQVSLENSNFKQAVGSDYLPCQEAESLT